MTEDEVYEVLLSAKIAVMMVIECRHRNAEVLQATINTLKEMLDHELIPALERAQFDLTDTPKKNS